MPIHVFVHILFTTVYILTDDQDIKLGSLDALPAVKSLIAEKGLYFDNAFVTTPVCCPSRCVHQAFVLTFSCTYMYLHNCTWQLLTYVTSKWSKTGWKKVLYVHVHVEPMVIHVVRRTLWPRSFLTRTYKTYSLVIIYYSGLPSLLESILTITTPTRTQWLRGVMHHPGEHWMKTKPSGHIWAWLGTRQHSSVI